MVDTNSRLVYNYYSNNNHYHKENGYDGAGYFFVKKQDIMPAEDRALFYSKVSSNSLN